MSAIDPGIEATLKEAAEDVETWPKDREKEREEEDLMKPSTWYNTYEWHTRIIDTLWLTKNQVVRIDSLSAPSSDIRSNSQWLQHLCARLFVESIHPTRIFRGRWH